MTNLKQIKKALFSSVMALLLCFTMLLGTTFAWFTDSVTSSGNKIQAGDLQIELWMHVLDENGNLVSTEITDESAPIFNLAETANENTAATLWEPGKTQTVYLSIKNNADTSSLDIKYSVALEVTDIVNQLNDVMSYVITPDAHVLNNPVAKEDLNWGAGLKVVEGTNVDTTDVALKVGEEHFFALSVHMDELAGNEYKNGSITFDIKVLAAQLASEYDSFDNQYDALATYGDGFFTVPTDENGYPVAGFHLDYMYNGEKVAAISVLTDALTTLGGNFTAIPTDDIGNIVIADNQSYVAYEVDLSTLKENNTEEMVLELRAPKGVDETTMTVYHSGEVVSREDWEYSAETGMVKTGVTGFSPFVIVYGGDPVVTDPEVEGKPEAIVERAPEFENVQLAWESYGDWHPSDKVEKEKVMLEAAYVFTAPHTAANVDNSKYADWYCDFYVSIDRDLTGNLNGKPEIFLGGNYGDWGWIGFHNDGFSVAANEEIPLLGSVTKNPWTYADVVKFVETFTCGVGDVDNVLSGATFTVKLRLTNPENSNDYFDAAVITHTFE